jgi:hypothetical protein
MQRLPQLLVVVLLGTACSPENSAPGKLADAAADGPGRDGLGGLNLPEVPPGCPPGVGNELGIGKPCTATGTECTGGLQCSCKSWFGYTMPASMPCFCTSVSFGNTCTSCGSKASCCTYVIPIETASVTVSACFPSVCLPGDECPVVTP